MRSSGRWAEVAIGAAQIEAIVDEPALRDAIALVAYACDLLRLEGLPTTAASLALWRGFAWTAEGSPRKRFVLTSQAIMAAEQALITRLRD